MSAEHSRDFVVEVLNDNKAIDVVVIDVRPSTQITDFMVFASGNTSRQVRALANELVEQSKASGKEVFSVEGVEAAEWALVDLLDVVVHIFQPATREFYRLEDLWALPLPAVVP